MNKLERILNRRVIRNTLLSPVVSILVSSVYFGFENDSIILIIIFQIPLIMIIGIFQVNQNYLLSLNENSNNKVIELKFYNFLDKIKKEVIDRGLIKSIRVNKRNTRTTIMFTDNRKLTLTHLKNKTLIQDGELQ